MSFLRKSQANLAYDAKVSLRVVRDLVAGKLPRFLDLYEIARILRVAPEYLAGYTDDASQDAFALAYSREDLDLLNQIRALSASDRESVMQLIKSLSTSAVSSRLNERTTKFDWGGFK